VSANKGPGPTASEVAKAQELVYELKIGEIMTRHLITVPPTATMHQVKNLLRDNRISGLPVMVNDQMVGITSIEDLILAMEHGALDEPVSKHMTRRVHTVYEDESVVQALNKFSQTHVGRFPVISRDDRLVGIITPDDITRGLFKALHQAYHEEEIRRYRASHLFEDIPSDRTSLHLGYSVGVRDFTNAGKASSQLKQALGRLGVDPRLIRRVAVAAYEAEMNIVIHSLTGGTLSAEVTANQITIVATDQGPGIPDLEKALQPGFSTAPDWIRELGFGAGMGLTNIRNSVDEFALTSKVPSGTELRAIVYLHRRTPEGETPDEIARNR
jgi:CBS domain-containing protein/anti-sigma regulatory factor (Ser/Thr protein kinase)